MRLAQLRFNGYLMNGVEVIVPPICDVPAGRCLMGSDKQFDPKPTRRKFLNIRSP
jgi:hypothetical protein